MFKQAHRTALVCLVLSILGSMGLAYGQQGFSRIFLGGHVYSGPGQVRDDSYWMPIDGYAQALHLKLHSSGDRVCLTTVGKGDAPCPIEQADAAAGIYVNSTLLAGGIDADHFIDTKAVTAALGGQYRAEVGLGTLTIDVKQAVAAAPPAAPAVAPAGHGSPPGLVYPHTDTSWVAPGFSSGGGVNVTTTHYHTADSPLLVLQYYQSHAAGLGLKQGATNRDWSTAGADYVTFQLDPGQDHGLAVRIHYAVEGGLDIVISSTR